MKKSEIAFGLIRIPVDFTMVIVGFLFGYGIRKNGDFIPGFSFPLNASTFPPVNEYVDLTIYFALLLIIVYGFFGLYKLKNADGPLKELSKVIIFSFVWILLIIAYYFALRQVFFSRLVLGFSYIITLGLLVLSRLLLQAIKSLLYYADIGTTRVLILGSNKISAKISRGLQKNPKYNIIGYISAKNIPVHTLKRLGSINDLGRIARRHRIEMIVQTEEESEETLQFCRENHIEYRFIPNLFAIERTNIEVEAVAGLPLIHMKPTPLDGWGKVIKRCFDIVLSLSSLILFIPLFIVVAIAIKLDSRGPILFRKLDDGTPAFRVGQWEKPFVCYKFRTMKDRSHSMREELKDLSHRKGPFLKIKNDPRVTGIGNFLRRTSIDELPQLWNVLMGDMSLVGPRPHIPEEVDQYEKQHKFVFTIKPGITGLSQISGRSDLDFDQEIKLDTFYIKNWTLFLDIKIILKTFLVVLGGKAAD
jgi:exopolysaccharide biosynthesis polyprenyl glycosylphosphotransferase